MKYFLCLWLIFFAGQISLASDRRVPGDDGVQHASALVHRLAPAHIGQFEFEIIPSPGGYDTFEIVSRRGKIRLRGNNVNSLCAAFGHYLKYYCLTSLSWYAADPLELPSKLPLVETPVRKRAKVNRRFFLNYCTFGYTMPWWGWADWERLIDWMALNGINTPLAITGQEAVWYNVWKKFGLSDSAIRHYFTGPAHLPWHRMSNIDRIQGPLPMSYINDQTDLQQRILARERQLGMKPVLTAFAGHVPKDITGKFPDAKISPLTWGLFPEEFRSYFLDPLDPLFRQIQRVFLEEQTKLYGTDHIYGVDPFNEVKPPDWSPAFLSRVSGTIYESIAESDPSATWLMMAWIFYFEREHWTNERIKAFLTAVPKDKFILLDYYCELKEVWPMTDAFFGYPYIWCYLGNFGGNTMLAGNVEEVGVRIDRTYAAGGSNFSGLGSTLEALDVNPLMYELVFEKAWDGPGPARGNWMDGWADRRFGNPSAVTRKAWKILSETVYAHPAKLGQGTLTNARPSLAGNGSGNWTDPAIGYNNDDLFEAWALLLRKKSGRQSYAYDIVNIGRQALGNYFGALRDSFTLAYRQRDAVAARTTGKRMLELLADLDTLLGTNRHFLAGKWISDARAMGHNEAEKNYFEQNARSIITIWGIADNSLNDYANRSWAGLMKSFYAARWEHFINNVINCLTAGTEFEEKAFYKTITAFEDEWTRRRAPLQREPEGDACLISTTLLEKYAPQHRHR